MAAEDKRAKAERRRANSERGGEQARDANAANTNEVTAPSIGPNTVIEKKPPEERLARHDQSSTDAMGLDKRRRVIGGGYGPSLARQLTVYGIFVVVVVAIGVGAKLLIDDLDQPPAKVKEQAPWAQDGVKQRPPPPLQ